MKNILQLIKNSWNQTCVIIVSKEWSDSQRRSLINYMAITESEPVFSKSIDGSGEIKNNLFLNALEMQLQRLNQQM